MLFSDQRIHSVKLPARDGNGRPASLALLIRHLVDHSMTDSRQQLFVLDGNLYVLSLISGYASWPPPSSPCLTAFSFSRPGILVLINDSDWELQGEESYELQSRDNVLFVSTLHGG